MMWAEMVHLRELAGGGDNRILVGHISEFLALNNLHSSPTSETDLVNTKPAVVNSARACQWETQLGTYSWLFRGFKAHIESQVAKYASIFALSPGGGSTRGFEGSLCHSLYASS
jgi:hypothetical protein